MKRHIPVLFTVIGVYVNPVAAQNAGIGTNNPIRAKLEVIGVSTGGATAALFGSNNAAPSAFMYQIAFQTGFIHVPE